MLTSPSSWNAFLPKDQGATSNNNFATPKLRPTANKPHTATRAFEKLAALPEPNDLSSFNERLPSKKRIQDSKKNLKRLRALLIVISLVQTACALVSMSTIATNPQGLEATLLLLTVSVTTGSGIVGFFGAWYEERNVINWFFITQIWCLSTVVSQFLRNQQSSRRQHLLCDDAVLNNASPGTGCANGELYLQSRSLQVTFCTVFASLFVSDSMSEMIQGGREDVNQLLVSRFVWQMRKRTLVGIHRFEESIHSKFEDLVSLGYIKVK